MGKILFDYCALHSFVATSFVNALGLEVETSEESLHVSSPLGIRVRIDQICWDCELQISGFYSRWTFGGWTYRSLMSFFAWVG